MQFFVFWILNHCSYHWSMCHSTTTPSPVSVGASPSQQAAEAQLQRTAWGVMKQLNILSMFDSPKKMGTAPSTRIYVPSDEPKSPAAAPLDGSTSPVHQPAKLHHRGPIATNRQSFPAGNPRSYNQLTSSASGEYVDQWKSSASSSGSPYRTPTSLNLSRSPYLIKMDRIREKAAANDVSMLSDGRTSASSTSIPKFEENINAISKNQVSSAKLRINTKATDTKADNGVPFSPLASPPPKWKEAQPRRASNR